MSGQAEHPTVEEEPPHPVKTIREATAKAIVSLEDGGNSIAAPEIAKELNTERV